MDDGREHHMRHPVASTEPRQFFAAFPIRSSATIGRNHGPAVGRKSRYPNVIVRTGWHKLQDMTNLRLFALAHRNKFRKPPDGRMAQAFVKQ
jgi:hypothetical protein